MNAELDLYVSTERAKGVPDETIRQNLKAAGWSDADIADAMKTVVTPMTHTTPWMMYILFTLLGLAAIIALWYFLWPTSEPGTPTSVPVITTVPTATPEPEPTDTPENPSETEEHRVELDKAKLQAQCDNLLSLQEAEKIMEIPAGTKLTPTGLFETGDGGFKCTVFFDDGTGEFLRDGVSLTTSQSVEFSKFVYGGTKSAKEMDDVLNVTPLDLGDESYFTFKTGLYGGNENQAEVFVRKANYEAYVVLYADASEETMKSNAKAFAQLILQKVTD